jgi:glyoxylase I family protein
VYFLSPWGMQFELVSYPHGKAFDKDPSRFA